MERNYDKNYYKNIWSKILRRYSVNSPINDLGDISRNKILKKLMVKYFLKDVERKYKNLTIHDYGAGNWLYLGGLLGTLAELDEKQKIVINGVDFSLQALNFGYSKFKKNIPKNIDINIIEADIQSYLKEQVDESVDCVICMETLEHLESYHGVVRDIVRILKKGGTFILSVPNRSPFVFSKNWFQYKFFKQEFTQKDIIVGHYRRYRVHDFDNLFPKSIKIEKVYYYGFLFSDYLKDMVTLVEKNLFFPLPLLLFVVNLFNTSELFFYNILGVRKSEGFFMVVKKNDY